MTEKKYYLIISILILLIILGALLVCADFKIKVFKIRFEYVGSNYSTQLNGSNGTAPPFYAFNLTGGDLLDFGKVSHNYALERDVEISNFEDSPIKFNVYKTGSAASWLSLTNTSFVLEPNQAINYTVRLEQQENALAGNYSGKVIFVLHKNILD